MLVLSLANMTNMHDHLDKIDCIEYRLDLIDSLAWIRPQKPFILTLRHHTHGGAYMANIDEMCQSILSYCEFLPDFVDLDIRLPQSLFQNIRKQYPTIKIIASYHQFEADIDKLKTYLNTVVDCDVLKLAMMCESAIDVLHLLQLKADKPLALIPMGKKASFGRVIGKIIGNAFDYVAPCRMHQTATGQLSIDEMIDIYHYHDLNQHTKIYALLANPVSHSVGHEFHNEYFKKNHHNAVYVKIEQDIAGLQELLDLMIAFPFYGVSLSMPLKQAFMHKQILNTLVRKHNTWAGYNTDGPAVINLLGLKQGMSVLILGNGGAAKGIEQACREHEISVVFLARQGGDYAFEDELPTFEVIINTLPPLAFFERPWFNAKLKRLVCNAQKRLDVIYHEITSFQECCIQNRLPFITGMQMFEAQAELQQDLWKSN